MTGGLRQRPSRRWGKQGRSPFLICRQEFYRGSIFGGWGCATWTAWGRQRGGRRRRTQPFSGWEYKVWSWNAGLILCLILVLWHWFEHNLTASNLRGESEGRLEAILSLLEKVLVCQFNQRSPLTPWEDVTVSMAIRNLQSIVVQKLIVGLKQSPNSLSAVPLLCTTTND